MSTPDLSAILAGATIEPSPEELRPTRKPRNQGVPELDPDVWKAYETGQAYDIGPVDEEHTHTLKLALQKSARYLSRVNKTDVRVTVNTIRRGGVVLVRFTAHPPKMMGRAVNQARNTDR